MPRLPLFAIARTCATLGARTSSTARGRHAARAGVVVKDELSVAAAR